jgi:TATA-box binding protein (TBP) (component of TFIID and TFIIIB)
MANEKNLTDLSILDLKPNKIVDNISEASSEVGSVISSTSYCKICDPKCKYFDCICPEEWCEFDNIFNEIINLPNEILLNPLRISTITLCFNLNSKIFTEKLDECYVSRNNGKFYNSFIFNWHTKYQLKTIVSVKMFPNGKIQIAGLANIKSCAYIMRKVHRKCKDFYEDVKNAKICDVKIAMINSDFKINNTIDLISCIEILSNNSIQTNGNFLSIVYQPIKYPAINTKIICDKYLSDYNEHFYKHSFKKKYKNRISVMIFRSGSIIITGGNDINDYLFTYKYLLNLIKINKKTLFI